MNDLIKQGLITEITGTQNTQYVFNDNSLFSLTEYKVLRSQNKNFAKCSKVLFNGKVKLLYFTSTYKSLKNMINNIDFDTFLSIITNVFGCMIEIKSNGFLSCTDLDISFDKIFVDQNTLEVFLVYLPITNSETDMLSFENEFRSEIIKLISSVPAFSTEKSARVCNYLANGNLSLEQIHHNIRGEINSFTRTKMTDAFSGQKKKEQMQNQPVLVFSSINSVSPIRFSITQPEFLIGKNAAKVNGAITYNQAISRIHCKITFENGNYYITDMGSANGTFVNNNRIVAHTPKQLANGTLIKLANSDFKVEF